MSDDFLNIFGGEAVETDAASVSDKSGMDHMYSLSESVFGDVAPQLVENGWSVFPQDVARRPGRVKGKTIAWSKEHQLPYKLPSDKALNEWVKYCPNHNVAVALGAGSGHTFALDIDVLDEEMSQKICALAEEILGETPFVRVGNAPKIALFYRYPPEEKISNVSRAFAATTDNGETVASEHALEILSEGKPITLMGRHHKTGRYFQWLKKSPLEAGPEEAPEVSSELLAYFMESVDENICRFHRNASVFATPEEVVWDQNKSVRIPRLKTVAGGAPWVEENGKIVDGREAYMFQLVHSFVRNNQGVPENEIVRHVIDQFNATVERKNSKWTPSFVQREAANKVNRLLSNIADGTYAMRFKNDNAVVYYDEEQETDVQEDPNAQGTFRLKTTKKDLLERGVPFLPDDSRRQPIRGRRVNADDPDANKPVILPPEERQNLIQEAGDKLETALDEFFEDVFAKNCGRDTTSPNKVHILKAPTGGGKTSRSIAYIGRMKDEHAARARAPRMDARRDKDGNIITPAQGLELEYKDDQGNLKEGSMPIVFLLPTYANIEEVRVRAEVLNLDPSLSDEELKEAALEAGLFPENEVESRIGDMRRDAMDAGLRVLVYKGKIAAGCKVADKVMAAMEAGVGTSGFCKSLVRREQDGELETVLCPHYTECPAILQKEEIQKSDLIFTPHPFMQLEIPEDLRHVRAVIADERVHHLFLHTEEFPMINLHLPRKNVRLTKAERERGVTEADLSNSRSEAVEIVTEALIKNKCPAEAIYAFKETNEEGNEINAGALMVEDCIRICSNAVQKDANLTPEMSLEEVLSLCSKPTGLHVREELQFWTIIQERIVQITQRNLFNAETQALDAKIKATTNPEELKLLQERKALRQKEFETNPIFPKGKKDMRIQYLRDFIAPGNIKETIRISWRTRPNWIEIPTLLLDASAAPDIIEKIWNGADVKIHDIGAPLHMRVVGIVDKTYSNSNIVGKFDLEESDKIRTAQRFSQMRLAITTLASYYGHSRVVAGGSILLRKAINRNWLGPENVDWCHYGAMRGLDFAKFHAAAVSVGRMELPLRTIDGLVAALTYDDPKPELPFDRDGTGLVKGTNRPLMLPTGTQSFKMRSGENIEIPTPMHPRRWGRMIQRQYREEELNQFCGRLRPVYREGDMPVWFAMSSVIPEELIVDDFIHIDDLVPKGKSTANPQIWEAVRKTEGIIHPDVMLRRCPEIFADKASTIKVMARVGFDYTTGNQNGPKTDGFTCYKIVSDRPDAFAWVKTIIKDGDKHLGAALDAAGISYKTIEHVRTPVERDVMARERPVDNIEAELGDRDARRAGEKELEADADAFLLSLGAYPCEVKGNMPSHPLRFLGGMGYKGEKDTPSFTLTYLDLEAYKSLEQSWNIMAHDEESQKALPILSTSGESYDTIGNVANDGR